MRILNKKAKKKGQSGGDSEKRYNFAAKINKDKEYV